MFLNFLFYSGGAALVLIAQALLSVIIEKNNGSKSSIKTDFIAILVFAVVFGMIFTVGNELLRNHIDFKIVIIIFIGALISSYWFFVAPIFYLFRKGKNVRDIGIEKQLQSEGYSYKVLFSDEISLNAYCTGGLPHLRLIIIANDLKSRMNDVELKSIIYHEIGHHERKHLIKLFGINILLFTSYYLMFDFILGFELPWYWELGAVAIGAGIAGLVFYYVPNRILYHLEYEADLFSAKHNQKQVVMNALIKFDEITNGELTKGNVNHPNLKKRLENLKRFG